VGGADVGDPYPGRPPGPQGEEEHRQPKRQALVYAAHLASSGLPAIPKLSVGFIATDVTVVRPYGQIQWNKVSPSSDDQLKLLVRGRPMIRGLILNRRTDSLARFGVIDRSSREIASRLNASLYACHHQHANGYRPQLLRYARTEARKTAPRPSVMNLFKLLSQC
jgi:hypothetical protein